MRLVNMQTQQPLVEFKENETIFYNKFLEKEMKTMGIPIPPGMRGLYEGKDVIYLGESSFQKAFKDVYYVTVMDTDRFRWLEERIRKNPLSGS